MNGDIGKLPTGAVYPATSEPLGSVGGAVATTASSLDYSVMNGELMLDPGMGGLEPSPQHIGLVGAVAGGFATVEGTPLSEVQAVPTSMTDLSIIGISLDQLKQMLSSQLEYYFSRENLANDTYLLSQMDNDQYVPIWTVANFNQVKKLTKDIKLITEVLRESPNVQVDEEGQKVRPNHKRCIVILREIPDNTPLEEVKNLFSGEGCPKLISCEFAHNSSWYVTFESDEDAQKAYRFLREEVREFQGKPIMARIKAKPMNRLPIPTVTGVGGIKNGYRTPPPPPPPPVYDPSSYSPGQQRFLYTNGTTMPQTTIPPYPNQVHLYHQPFYPTSMMHWGPASPAYFDMATGVFTMNGITPHNSFKPHTRFNPRNRNKHRNGSERSGSGLVDNSSNGIVQTSRVNYTPKNNGGSSGGGSMSGSGNIGGGGATSVSITPIFTTNTHPTTKSTSSSYQQSAGTKYHLSHMTSTAIEPQYVTSHHHIAKSGQENEGHTSENPSAVQYNPRHRVHRRTKDQEGGVTTKTSSNTLPAIRESVSSSGSVSATSSVVTSTANSNNNNNNNSNNNNNNNSSNSNTQQYNRNIVQFDLGASAFPPLPGLDADLTTKSHIALTEPSSLVDLQSQNRLSDVVKGTAKLKSAGIKDKDQTVQQQINISSRSVSPGPSQPVSQPVTDSIATSTVETESNTVAINDSPASSAGVTNISDSSDITLSTVTLTPPSSPDKSIKTDDLNMVNGVDETISTNAHAAEITVSVMRCDCDNPVATPNVQSQRGVLLNFSLDIHRPSYAQVAQHYCEQSCTKHRLEEKDGSN